MHWSLFEMTGWHLQVKSNRLLLRLSIHGLAAKESYKTQDQDCLVFYNSCISKTLSTTHKQHSENLCSFVRDGD